MWLKFVYSITNKCKIAGYLSTTNFVINKQQIGTKCESQINGVLNMTILVFYVIPAGALNPRMAHNSHIGAVKF